MPSESLSFSSLMTYMLTQLFASCLWPRQEKQTHHCFLIGPVVRDRPVAPFNRTVVWVPDNARSVETGTFAAVKNCGGKIKDIAELGRVAVPVEDHLWIIQHWVEQILELKVGAQFNEIVKELQVQLARYSPEEGIDTLQLDVFSAVVVNQTEDKVFIYKNPSSFP